MRVLLLYIPSRIESVNIPYGLLYVANSVQSLGHDVRIFDLALKDYSEKDVISQVNDYHPHIIGFGAITSGYRNLKKYSHIIRLHFMDIPLIAGGVIASISDILLKHTPIDIVVLGEGEIVIKNLLNCLENGDSLSTVRGIAFRDQSGHYIETEPQKQITRLDEIPFPPYSLIDFERYCESEEAYMRHYNFSNVLHSNEIRRIKEKRNRIIPIFSSRGCTNRCSFCYRHMQGVRQFSPGYVVRLMQFLQNRYDIHFFQFIDELTNVSKKWGYELCTLIDENRLDINYTINGARVSNIDAELLKRFRKTGCIKVTYGYESGSQKILDHIGKGVTREQNLRVGRLMKKARLHDTGQVVIGFPPESPETIRETIDFMKTLDPENRSINYVLPFPKTKDWEYCIENGLIKDPEQFILDYDEASTFRVNMTQYPDRVVKRWRSEIVRALEIMDLRKNRRYFRLVVYHAVSFIYLWMSGFIEYNRLPRVIKRLHKTFMGR